jgi:hypothetical protein
VTKKIEFEIQTFKNLKSRIFMDQDAKKEERRVMGKGNGRIRTNDSHHNHKQHHQAGCTAKHKTSK